MKRFFATIILLLSSSIILTACNTDSFKKESEIIIMFKISNLTDEEFNLVETKNLDDVSKDDFKNIEFSLDVKNSDKLLNRKVIIPDFKNIIKTYDEKRYWFGKSSSQDNPSENFAQYNNKVVFYSKGLDEEAIKNIFSGLEVKISWITDKDENKDAVFKLDEIIQFQD